MTDYTKTTDFTAKNTASITDPAKVLRGEPFDLEFNNVATAISSKFDNTSTVDINSGTIDGTVIGANSAAAGSFTTVNGTTIDTTNIETTNLKAKDGTSAGSIADSTGVVTLASSVLTTTDINGGTIDGTPVGSSVPSSGVFTTLTGSGVEINTSVSGTAVLDDDTFATASSTTLATSESIKALVDSAVVVASLVGITSTATSSKLEITNSLTTFDTDVEFNTTTEKGITVDGLTVGKGSESSSGENNFSTAIGYEALESNTTGSYNTALGYKALKINTTGDNNTAIGYEALDYNTLGYNNTAVGFSAAGNTSTGTDNTGVGYLALSGNATGVNNVAVGSYTLLGSSGDNNIGIGYAAGAWLSGEHNIAIGKSTLGDSSNTAGHNIAIGKSAGGDITTGDYNVLIGINAGRDLETQYNNTVVGAEALLLSSAGFGENTVVGSQAMYNNTSGGFNVAIGKKSLGDATTGLGNTAIGYESGVDKITPGNSLITGSNNILIGEASLPSSSSVNNEITLGNNLITNLRCADTTISTLSDSRDKANIQDVPLGLDFINQLRPVSFDWNTRDGSREGRKDFGFIAQELDVVSNASGYKDHLRLVHKNNPDKLEADPLKTYPVLIKAVQELSEMVEQLKAKVAALESA